MKQHSLINNVIYNFIYTGLNILFPLITAPYVSRVLSAPNLGKVNFAAAFVNWFVLFAVFGVSTYGVREISKIRDNKEKINKVFSELFIINAILSIIVAVIYLIIVFNINRFNSERMLFLIMVFSIILNMFNIDWFFQGIEDYGYITARSALFKTISLVCIFLFIKRPEHYVIYGIISVASTSLSGILNFLYSRKLIRIQIKNINPLRHVRYLGIFFLITFIINIYTTLDQVLLGLWVDNKSVAFMNRTKTVINIAIALSTSISNATLSRASYYRENENNKYKSLITDVSDYILWIVIPITAGCIFLAPNIMYILGGSEFLEASILMQIMSITVIFSPLSTYLQSQILVTSGNERMGLYCAILTSAVSLTCNIILIPKVGFVGAGIVQVISEVIAVSSRYYISKKVLGFNEIKFINKSSVSYIIAAAIMSFIVVLINHIIENLIWSFILSSIIGAIVYILILLLIRERITLSTVEKLISKLKYYKKQ